MGAEYVWVRHGVSGRYPRVKSVILFLLYVVLGGAAGRSLIGGLAPFAVPMAVTAAFLAAPMDWAVIAGLVAGVFTLRRNRLPAGGGGRGGGCGFHAGQGHSGAAGPSRCCPEHSPPAASTSWSRGIFLLHQSNPAALFGLLSESVLVSLFTPVILYGFSGVSRVKERQKELRVLLVLVFMMCGLGDLHIGPAALREILARCILITVAYGWGAGWGAGAGVILGLLGGNLQTILPRTGFYAGIGFFAGVLQGFGRTGVIVGFFLASMLFSIFYGNPGELSGHLLASLLTVGIFFLASPFINRWLGREKPETLTGFAPGGGDRFFTTIQVLGDFLRRQFCRGAPVTRDTCC